MSTFIYKLRVWLIIRLAGDRSVLMNVKVNRFPAKGEGLVTFRRQTEAILAGAYLDGEDRPLVSGPGFADNYVGLGLGDGKTHCKVDGVQVSGKTIEVRPGKKVD